MVAAGVGIETGTEIETESEGAEAEAETGATGAIGVIAADHATADAAAAAAAAGTVIGATVGAEARAGTGGGGGTAKEAEGAGAGARAKRDAMESSGSHCSIRVRGEVAVLAVDTVQQKHKPTESKRMAEGIVPLPSRQYKAQFAACVLVLLFSLSLHVPCVAGSCFSDLS